MTTSLRGEDSTINNASEHDWTALPQTQASRLQRSHNIPLLVSCMHVSEQEYEHFRSELQPYLSNVKRLATRQLEFFQIFDGKQELEMDDNVIANYELFMHLCRRKDVDVVPSLEVQLMWMVHALNPRDYFKDCADAFKEQMAVELRESPRHVYHRNLDKFRHEMVTKVSPRVWRQIVSEMHRAPAYSFLQHLDIKQAIVRQMIFVNKMNAIQRNCSAVSMSQIDHALERYCQFLYLMKVNKSSGTRSLCVP
eukprot:CAMPEP_0202707886 /NCGR_PEP_ID=MMETSP1385-20130828/20156_1 /ASSEMBLY_ACC=CAM_ASM_000861 /TAXON_ID=933848 /ORGANISM="Elphidium margaritaceum" /LENGTH=251 /DNA_ID=CAMNT_0049366695 /DNA_START=57 /DNA_END=808 /DNA_ORIENTATION=+